MSDSTIDDALKLLEIGKGNPDRLKQIIKSFQKRSMISMQDRKYVDALVEQYLTPRHRQMTSKMKETKIPRIRKSTESSFKITEVKAKTRDPYIKPSTDRRLSKDISNSCSKCGSKILEGNTFCTNCGAQTKNESQPRKEELASQPRKEELASKEPTIEEKFIEHVEADHTSVRKSRKGKATGIVIGLIAVIIIGGGAAYMGSSSDLFSSNTEVEERITCQDNIQLVSSTKVPNFPSPGKDLNYYQDRYDNEQKYKDWFDKNFPGQTVREVLVPQMGDKEIRIPGFPDPEKDLQHYLDRYDNEQKYKDWFDKNFPGQTVREAVC
ncbi:zinc ribbon domain-containing protein [Candidatus Nitrosopelagicus sp.]|nr:zinc ribbon domain-containing protein [Candidatus Nitrosopelagicus sp.]